MPPHDEPAFDLHVVHRAGPGPSVLYVHGATFPTALSIGYRIDGRSWIDDLADRGFDVWSFDLAGYGGSRTATLGRGDAAEQIAHVVAHIGRPRVSLVAHSWGTIPATRFAITRPDRVEALVLFGPIARRDGPDSRDAFDDAPLLISADDQWNAFQAGVPDGEAPPFARSLFERWAEDYLATDPDATGRTPHAVHVPAGPATDVAACWSGVEPFDAAALITKTLIVRGAWDEVCNDDDARRLATAMTAADVTCVTLPRGGHRMHLETERHALFETVGQWLSDATRPGQPRHATT